MDAETRALYERAFATIDRVDAAQEQWAAEAAARDLDAEADALIERRAEPQGLIYKTFITPQEPAAENVTAPTAASRDFVLQVAETLADEVAALTGKLERRIATLEAEVEALEQRKAGNVATFGSPRHVA